MTGLGGEVLRILCSYPFQLLIAVHLFAYPTFRRRKFFILYALLIALPVMIGFDMSVRYFPNGMTPSEPVLDRVFLLIPSALYYVMLRLSYFCTAREALFCLSFAVAIQNAVFNLFWLIMRKAGFPEYSLPSLCVSWTLMLLLYGTGFMVMRRWMKNREGHVLPLWRVAQNTGVIVFFVVFLTRRAEGSPYEVYVYLAYFLADLLALSMQVGLLHEVDLERQKDMIGQLLASEQKKNRMTVENVELINRKCHDLKHQIAGLRRMKSDTERDSYISRVEDAVLFFESAGKTGNETLDLILMEKQLYCKEHGVTLTCVCDGEKLKFMDTMDLYALFGNALDNAIESVVGEAPENRIISFRVGMRGGFVSVHFENYLGHPVKLMNGLPQTTKDDRTYHGFGVLSIQHIVEKYGGTMSIRTDRNLYRLDILLPAGEMKI